MAKKNEVAKNGAFDFDVTERPDHIVEGGRGNEQVGVDDLTIPRIDVIQSLSPQRKPTDPAYIEGASEGMLFNSVSSKLYGTTILFIPCFFRKEWLIWKDRKKGGGFRGAFASQAEANTALALLDDAADCEIQDTGQHFGIVVDPESKSDAPITEEVVISMSRTKMKASRKLNSLVSLGGGDRFSRVYEVSGIPATNAAGEEYYNFDVKQKGFTPQVLFEMAEVTYAHVSQGVKDINRNEPAGETTDSEEEEEF